MSSRAVRDDGDQPSTVRPVARTDPAERPVAFQPCADRVVKHRVELRTVRAYPGTDVRIMFTRAGAALALAARRVVYTQPMTSPVPMLSTV